MNNTFGLSVAAHILILQLFYIKKQVKTRLIPFTVMIFVSFLLILSSVLFLIPAVKNNSNLSYMYIDEKKCVPLTQQKPSDKKVILRIDDVQPYAWRDITIAMSDEAFKRNMPVVYGVIPNHLADGRAIVNYTKRHICNVEIALHGWDHSDFEFMYLNESQATAKLAQGKQTLEHTFGSKVTTFIPPFNILSRDSKVAVEKSGFKVISSLGKEKYDFDSIPAKGEEVNSIQAESILKTCRAQLNTYNICVIMLHPQDYANDKGSLDETEFKEYLKLLDIIKIKGMEVTTFQKESNK